VSRKNLIIASLVADALDIALVGQIPGLSYFIDLPVIAMHVIYAGPGGLATLLELVPVVGTLPIFTLASLRHGKGNH
jgi:hypothetical protein